MNAKAYLKSTIIDKQFILSCKDWIVELAEYILQHYVDINEPKI